MCVCVKNVGWRVCGVRWTDLGGGGHLLEMLDESAEAGLKLGRSSGFTDQQLRIMS